MSIISFNELILDDIDYDLSIYSLDKPEEYEIEDESPQSVEEELEEVSGSVKSIDSHLDADPLRPIIRLRETDHIHLFGAPCAVLPAHTMEGMLAEEDNERYRNKLNSGRVLKTMDSQTDNILKSTRGTCIRLPPSHSKTNYVNKRLLLEGLFPETIAEEESKDLELNRQEELKFALERLLVSNYEKPIPLRVGNFDVDPLIPEISFTYTPKVLSKLYWEELKFLEVTCIDQNSFSPIILAVGYSHHSVGKVGIWNFKNTANPEKVFKLEAAVSAISFSYYSPNMLAVGFKIGGVVVIDISQPKLNILYSISHFGNEIVWHVDWWGNGTKERLVYSAGAALYRIKKPFITNLPLKIMSASHLDAEGLHMGVLGWSDEPITIGPQITALLDFDDNHYIFGCSDGYIKLGYVFSTQRFIGKAIAHLGIVNVAKRCPSFHKVFLTAGTDGTIHIWAANIWKPLITLEHNTKGINIIDAAWSRKHGTVIVGATIEGLSFWDIKRKGKEPVSTTAVPQLPNNIEFSKDGELLIVGTAHGSVYLMALENMPFPEKNTDTVCSWAIIRQLQRQGQIQLLKQVKQMRILEKIEKNSN